MSVCSHIYYTHTKKNKNKTKLGLNYAFNSLRDQLVTVTFFFLSIGPVGFSIAEI